MQIAEHSRRRLVIGLLGMLFAGSAAAQSGEVDTFGLAPPQSLSNPKQVYATAYIVQSADESADPGDPELLDPVGVSLGVRIPRRAWCLAADEGSLSVNLRSGGQRAYAYSGRGSSRVADCSDVFRSMRPGLRAALERSTFRLASSDAPYGVGARSTYRLVPYRSIAIDLRPVGPLRLGQVVFIPRLRGAQITLPNGQVVAHDGYVMAVDTGGAIRGQHIDFFEGPRPTDVLIAELRAPFLAYVVNDPQTVAFLTRLHSR